MRKRLLVVVALGVVITVAGMVWRATRKVTFDEPGAAERPGTPRARAGGAGSGERGPLGASSQVARREPAGERRAFDRLRADGVRERAAERGVARRAGGMASATASPASASEPPPMTVEEEQRRRQYIQSAVREQYIPIARACYEELLGRQPTAAGQVVMSFAIVGDGKDGVVSEVELADGTTMDDSELTLCMRESMYATIFEPPPPGAEATTVVYPLTLAPDPP